MYGFVFGMLLWCGIMLCFDASLDLSTAYVALPYNQFHVRLYAEPFEGHDTKLYYAPACVFIPNSSYIISNNNHQNYVAFSVKLWDREYHDAVQAELSKINRTVIQRPRPIPFHSVRMDVIDSSVPVTVMNQWIPIPHQPSVVLGRIICTSETECSTIKSAVENPQDQLLFGLEMSFALKKPVRIKRVASVSARRFDESEIFQTMKQKLASQHTVCMQYPELQRMVRQVLESLFESIIPDEEYVSENQLYSAVNRLIRLIQPNVTTTADFTDEEWNSVFWPTGTVRPDEKIKNLNELLGNGNKWMKAFFQIGSNFSTLEGIKPVQEIQPQLDWSIIRAQLKDTDGIVYWNGDKFVIKPIILHCINLTRLSSDIILGNVTSWSSSKSGNLTSAVNVPTLDRNTLDVEIQRLKRSLNQTEHTVGRLSNRLADMVPIGTIVAYHQRTLISPCWLLCDGAPFNNTTYPSLAIALYPETTTPDLRGKFPMGAGSTEYPVVGESGGEASHVLTGNEMPLHSHEIPSWSGPNYGNQYLSISKLTTSAMSDRTEAGQNGGERKKLTSLTAGGGLPHNNLPPFLTSWYIIRAC